jgi:type II secretory pathway component GspD/PulD (secretin)/Flp pilus assembly protein TadD
MNRAFRSLAVATATLAACSVPGGASPPRLDHEEGNGAPSFQPLLVVAVPALQPGAAVGRPMDALQARATPLADVLLTLFRDSDLNLVIDPAVQGRECTVDIKRSTVEETFEALLEGLDLGYEWDGTFLRIVPTVEATVVVDLMTGAASGGGGPGGGSGGGSGGGGSGGGASSASFWDDLEQTLPNVLGADGTFVLNRTASAIHVRARPSGLRRLHDLIGTTTRRANKQVSLEARVLEVRLENEYSLGVNWGLLPGLFNSNKVGLTTGGAVAAQAARSGGSALTFGVLDTNDFSVFVDALQSQGQVRVLSSPRVSTLNNQTATIAVTDQVPFITREVITEEGIARTEFSVEFAQTGVLLAVRPLIGDDGLLSVQVTPSVREQIGTAVTPDGLVSVPVISERQATTTVRVADGQAIALGGLRSTRKSETRSGVPFLMDVPWLGQLFSSTVQQRDEIELMILLVPRVLDDTWIAEEIQRGAHRLVQLRQGFQWNAIRLDGHRPEDWSAGSLQGLAQAAASPGVLTPDRAPAPLAPERGATVTRQGLAAHLRQRAESLLARGDRNAALATLERALQLDPGAADALTAAAVLRERAGDRVRARTLLDRALEIAPDDPVALTARGALALDEGSAFAARRLLARAHELADTPVTASNLAAAMLVLGEATAARELLGPRAPTSRSPELHANLAFAELRTGAAARARNSLRQALVHGADPRNPRLVALDRLIAEAEKGLPARP